MRAAVYFLAAARVVSCLVPLSNTQQSRSRFLSSSAAAFFASGLVLASDSESCSAKTMAEGSNPRYIDRELEMKYAEDKNGNPRTRGMLVRRFTGDSTPYSFPVTPIRLVKEWPDEPPFKPEDFFRADEIDDGSFYAVPRLVYHIDEPAVASLTQYYRNNIPAGSNILDICSSWISHYPLEFPDTMKRISATGMNKLELMYNDQLTDYQAKNLNVDPTLPYDDNTFNVVTCVVSIDYLISPIQVLKEVNRVLKPGGKVIISQSNRCFPSKAIAMWLQMNDRQHLELINGYLKYAGGFKDVKVFDITATDPGNKYNDPMFIVQAEKA
jgi:SAM-dependent methyltransferase